MKQSLNPHYGQLKKFFAKNAHSNKNLLKFDFEQNSSPTQSCQSKSHLKRQRIFFGQLSTHVFSNRFHDILKLINLSYCNKQIKIILRYISISLKNILLFCFNRKSMNRTIIFSGLFIKHGRKNFSQWKVFLSDICQLRSR